MSIRRFVRPLVLAVVPIACVVRAGDARVAFLAPEALPSARDETAVVAALGKEKSAALALARALRGATLLFPKADGTFVDAAGKPATLRDFRVVWYHQGDSAAEDLPVYGQSVTEALRSHVNEGGGLFLSGAALALVHRLGVEPVKPRTGGPAADDYRAAFVPAVADHPIFAGLAVEGVMLDASVGGNPRTCVVRVTSAGMPAFADFCGTGGPRAGRVLARAPSGENPIVEYALGAGRIVAMGWRLPHYADALNEHRANLERLTNNILGYLGNASAWRAVERTPIEAVAVPSRREKGIEDLALALRDLVATFGERYPKGAEFLTRLEALARDKNATDAQIEALRSEALLANPLLAFGKLLVVVRGEGQLGLPANWQANSDLPMTGYDNRIAALSPLGPEGELATVYQPEGGRFVGDVDLDWDARKILFSMPGANGRWQVCELGLQGGAVRELALITEPDVDNYDACYLPDGLVLFTSTAPFVGVPCVYGSTHVTNAYRQEADGSIRQLTVDQEHNWCPVVANDGRVVYSRWEYTDLPHSNSRRLFVMNPDGTGQAEYYGSSSFFPNSFFYARPIPGHPTMVAGIASGHHGTARSGRLLVLDPARGRREASGVVQEIPGRGVQVPALIRDTLVDGVWPQFLHPFPLSAKYFLVSAKLSPEARWGIYLVDVFDNMVLVKDLPGYALLEPVPFVAHARPPVVPAKIDRARPDAVVLMTDVYAGEGLRGVPRGTVKKLRLISYHFSYRGMGGLLGSIGMDGPWDIKRVLGTVPVEPDGSAFFRVPANVPIAVQPLDEKGQALQLMRSWFTCMPGEQLTCVGCHESQNTSSPNRSTLGMRRGPSEIEPWHGPARGFAFAREVQPVLDRHCVSCHDGTTLSDLRGERILSDWTSGIAGSVSSSVGGKFSTAYAELHRFVRRPGIESDIRMLAPMEFHAETTELVQLLSRGHHGVVLAAEDWDRLVTWIDLNAPYHGTWGEIVGQANAAPQAERRRAMSRRYANVDIDAEEIVRAPAARSVVARAEVTVHAAPAARPAWAFDAAEARRRQCEGASNPTRTLDLGAGVTLALVRIPAGEFVMGGEHGGPANERPNATVRIEAPFWMGTTEVTNAQFACFDPAHESRVEPMHGYQFGIRGWPVDRPNQPVVRVSWERAQAFCEWLSGRIGAAVQLPTEAQWEYACRAGTASDFWYGTCETDFAPFANLGDSKLRDYALDTYVEVHFVPNPNKYDDWVPKDARRNDGAFVSADVGSYAANPWGLYDMHGNVWEWTRSAYASCPYREGAGSGAPDEYEVVRGGSWYDRPFRATSSYRLAYRAYQPVFNVGFRIVVAGDTFAGK